MGKQIYSFINVSLILFLMVSGTSILLLAPADKAIALPPDTPNPNTWVTNGDVYAITMDGPITYIGGDFTYVGPNTGQGAPISATTGKAIPPHSRVDGSVLAVAPDDSGGWYIGGDFYRVGGVERIGIAHVFKDGTLDASWNPNLDSGSCVYALAVSGRTVYVGGILGYIGGQRRDSIAAVDAKTGAVTSWNPNITRTVFALAVTSGVVYAGGYAYLSAIDVATGDVTPLAPVDKEVYALAVSGNTIYAGGSFTVIGAPGQFRNYIAAIDATTGSVTPWNPNADQRIDALAVNDGVVYAGGWFTSIGDQKRNYLAAIDANTGLATSWDPNADRGISALAVSDGVVYTGGSFTTIGGQTRYFIAAIDALTDSATSWSPNANGSVYALSLSNGVIYAGGSFNSTGGQLRNYIAAINAETGETTSWNPQANGWVHALAVDGTVVYAGGEFASIGGQLRNRLAAIDITGAANSWDPNANGSVFALAVNGGVVYAGGWFTIVGGQVRNNVAAIDASTGLATSWNPDANDWVQTLAISNTVLYAGGWFTLMGGQSRNYIAAIDTSTGSVTSWNPNANSSVHALAPSNGIVYAGGGFTSIGGQARNYIAAINATTGSATDWRLDAPQPVWSLVTSGGVIYVGGNYYLSAFDLETGSATSWNPNIDGSIYALVVSGTTVYAGGSFESIDGEPQSHFAQFGVAEPPSPPANVSASDGTYVDKVELRWLASPGATSYKVYRATSLFGGKTALGSTADPTFDDTTATPKKTYYYWVKALNSYGTSSFSSHDAGYRSDGSPPTAITVLSPNGVDNWAAGSTQTIRWTYTENPGPYVRIELLKGGVVNRTIKSFVWKGTGGSGSFNWRVPANLAPGTDYRIRMTSTTYGGCTYTSDSDFTIAPPTITLVSPNSGETWNAGSMQTIRWNYTGNPGSYVKIELLKGGVVNRTIAWSAWKGSGGSGSRSWKIPLNQAPGTDYSIRVTSTSNNSYSDTSDSNFTISR